MKDQGRGGKVGDGGKLGFSEKWGWERGCMARAPPVCRPCRQSLDTCI